MSTGSSERTRCGPPSVTPTPPPSSTAEEDDEEASPPGRLERSGKRPLSTTAAGASQATPALTSWRKEIGLTRDGPGTDPPTTVRLMEETWVHDPEARAGLSRRSLVWTLLDLYTRTGSEDVIARCRVCALCDVATFLFLKDGASSNGTKHFETTGKGKGSEAQRADHLLAALYLAKNIKGGPRTRVTAADGTITQFMRPAARREHHLRFVMMLVMTSSANAFAKDEYVRAFLAGFRINYAPPAPATVVHHLTELASHVSSSLKSTLTRVKEAYRGLPWGHVCLDMWTARHSSESYGSVVVRYTDVDSMSVCERSLGVWRCAGKHTYASIRAWLGNRLQFFDLGVEDMASSTTDSGANVRKAMIGLAGSWVPCAAHALHNAVRHALGGSGETANQLAERVGKGGLAARQRRKACRNTAAREVLARLRSTIRYFMHSDAEAQKLREVSVSDDPNPRGLIQEVSTRWGSTFDALSRLYTMWPRLSVYFRSTTLSADQRKRRVSNRDWDKLRHLIGVLTPAFEVTKSCQSSSATLADTFSLLVALRQTMLRDCIATPKFPDVPLAVGAVAIEAFLAAEPDEDVFEVDGRLYPSELVYVEPRSGFDYLCDEARETVYILRTEIDRLFFNATDDSKNWLRNKAVLRAMLLTPGGAKMLREVALWLDFEDPTEAAEAAVVDAGATLVPSVPVPPRGGSGAGPSSSSGLSAQRAAARSSLVLWGASRSPTHGRALGLADPTPSVEEELSRFYELSACSTAEDSWGFWRRHRDEFRYLFFVAASAFGAVGSSSSCEREFSIAGRLVRGDRATLSVTSVEMHSLVAANADVIPFSTTGVAALTHAAAMLYRGELNTFMPTVPDAVEDAYASSDTSAAGGGGEGGSAAGWSSHSE